MQQPTHHRLHLRDAHDAHVVFEAVSRRGLPPITRRLNESERRDLVRSGAVFVWFEAEDDSGLMRWTGMSFHYPRVPFQCSSSHKTVAPGVRVVCERYFALLHVMHQSHPLNSLTFSTTKRRPMTLPELQTK